MTDAPGVTSTDATAAGLTVTRASASCDSIVTRIHAVPDEFAVTTPSVAIDAMTGSDVAHVATRPGSSRPAPFRAIAVSATTCPSLRSRVAGRNSTLATGARVTSSKPDPTLPPDAALITVVPAACAVTTPPDDTVATSSLADVQTTASPSSAWPLRSRRRAE